MKLYQITSRYREVLADLDSDIEDAVLMAELIRIDELHEEKVLACAAIIEELEAEAAACKKAADKISDRRRAALKRVAWIKNYVLESMKALNKKKIKDAQVVVTVRKHRPGVEVLDPGGLPDKYFKTRTVTELDLETLRQDLEDGLQTNAARLGRSTHLVIK